MANAAWPKLCLGIETSCDETSLALVAEGRLLDQVLASQSDLHALFGGVVPELASREHYRYIGPLLDELLKRTQVSLKDLTHIAVTRGPGLLGSLLVGVALAKALALGLEIPLIGINHLEAHLLACGLNSSLEFPALGLLISGGHTNIYRIEAPEKFQPLGKTLDDACGEAIDKIGNLLGFPYPSGKLLDQAACLGIPEINFTLPYIHNDNLNFSFSGLKTSVATYISQHLSSLKWEKPIKEVKNLPQEVLNLCASFNLAIAKTLALKLERAYERNRDLKYLWMAGGVAANSCIQKEISKLAKKLGLSLRVPPPLFCTDNGAMIAYAGYLLACKGYYHDLDLETIPRGQVIPWDYKQLAN
ncbi:MAG: tRNA (adenosine(37)-N6)-threonylcarbamoyltransferase complex transferase subunit TsaD [Desulfovibrionaceae bacterium]|nr:tRNA (adenosine(37)-N6)-threonylcarbamoyltransferase complex transferase subunit TsaD [Desulfovibrionaceae bacterium]